MENGDEASHQNDRETNEDPQTSQQPSESGDADERVVPTVGERDIIDVRYDEVERGMETVK